MTSAPQALTGVRPEHPPSPLHAGPQAWCEAGSPLPHRKCLQGGLCPCLPPAVSSPPGAGVLAPPSSLCHQGPAGGAHEWDVPPGPFGPVQPLPCRLRAGLCLLGTPARCRGPAGLDPGAARPVSWRESPARSLWMQGWDSCVCVPAANVSWGPRRRAGWLCFVFVLFGGDSVQI